MNNTILTQLLHDGSFSHAVIVLLICLGLNLVTGVGSALKHGTFDFGHVSSFLYDDVAKAVYALVVFFASTLTGNFTVAVLTLATTLIGLGLSLLPSILTNVAELLGQQNNVEFTTLLQQIADAIASMAKPKTPIIPPVNDATPPAAA